MSDIAHRLHQDFGERTTTFEVVQDVEPYLENNARLREMDQPSDWGRHLASVPNVVINQWLYEEWTRGNTGLRFGSEEWRRIVWKKLNDPAWAYLRVDKPPSAYRR